MSARSVRIMRARFLKVELRLDVISSGFMFTGHVRKYHHRQAPMSTTDEVQYTSTDMRFTATGFCQSINASTRMSTPTVTAFVERRISWSGLVIDLRRYTPRA